MLCYVPLGYTTSIKNIFDKYKSPKRVSLSKKLLIVRQDQIVQKLGKKYKRGNQKMANN
jgi:hypothetical protein